MEAKPRHRKLDEIAQMLKAAALHYGSVVLTSTGPTLEEAEKKLKLTALAFYQASRNEEEDRAISVLIALEQGDEPSDNELDKQRKSHKGILGFAEDDNELHRW
jgi:hypothetical protein